MTKLQDKLLAMQAVGRHTRSGKIVRKLIIADVNRLVRIGGRLRHPSKAQRRCVHPKDRHHKKRLNGSERIVRQGILRTKQQHAGFMVARLRAHAPRYVFVQFNDGTHYMVGAGPKVQCYHCKRLITRTDHSEPRATVKEREGNHYRYYLWCHDCCKNEGLIK